MGRKARAATAIQQEAKKTKGICKGKRSEEEAGVELSDSCSTYEDSHSSHGNYHAEETIELIELGDIDAQSRGITLFEELLSEIPLVI